MFSLLPGRFFKEPSILDDDIASGMLVSHLPFKFGAFTAKTSSLDCDVHVGKSSIDILHGNQETLAVLIGTKVTFTSVISFWLYIAEQIGLSLAFCCTLTLLFVGRGYRSHFVNGHK